jgi:16S rRNA (uracil1498-N3)-methyltransferase
MRVSRCYVPVDLMAGTQIELPEPLAHRLREVMRARSGDPLLLFDGHGREHRATLIAVHRHQAIAAVGEAVAALPESPLELTLAQGICRGEKMDLVIQKATELGVRRIVPLLTERVEVALQGERLQRRLAHWQQVAISAAEQSGRSCVPEVAEPIDIGVLPMAAALILDPSAVRRLSTLEPILSATLIVGPEGGISERELAQARGRGATPVGLGPRILRTETAGLAAIAALQARFGDL